MTSTIDTQGIKTLKCEDCGLYFALEDEDDGGNYACVDETGKCLSCQ